MSARPPLSRRACLTGLAAGWLAHPSTARALTQVDRPAQGAPLPHARPDTHADLASWSAPTSLRNPGTVLLAYHHLEQGLVVSELDLRTRAEQPPVALGLPRSLTEATLVALRQGAAVVASGADQDITLVWLSRTLEVQQRRTLGQGRQAVLAQRGDQLAVAWLDATMRTLHLAIVSVADLSVQHRATLPLGESTLPDRAIWLELVPAGGGWMLHTPMTRELILLSPTLQLVRRRFEILQGHLFAAGVWPRMVFKESLGVSVYSLDAGLTATLVAEMDRFALSNRRELGAHSVTRGTVVSNGFWLETGQKIHFPERIAMARRMIWHGSMVVSLHTLEERSEVLWYDWAEGS